MTTSTRESRALSGEIFLKIRIWKNDNKLSSQVLKDFFSLIKESKLRKGKKIIIAKKACEQKYPNSRTFVVVSYVRRAKIKFTNSCRTLLL